MSCYCNIHGLKNREDKCAAAEKRLQAWDKIINLTVHYGEKFPNSKRRAILTEAFRLLRKQGYNFDKVTINHWKKGKSNKQVKYLHHHVVVGADENITRRRIKQALRQAAEKYGHPEPSRIRLGYEQTTTPTPHLVYAFCIGKYKDRLVLPPPTVSWEMCRLGKIPKGVKPTPRPETQPTPPVTPPDAPEIVHDAAGRRAAASGIRNVTRASRSVQKAFSSISPRFLQSCGIDTQVSNWSHQRTMPLLE